jgi:hypothetical protein
MVSSNLQTWSGLPCWQPRVPLFTCHPRFILGTQILHTLLVRLSTHLYYV